MLRNMNKSDTARRKPRSVAGAALSSLLLAMTLAACTASGSGSITPVDPNDIEPSPTPIATATPLPTDSPTPVPSATATPGWSSITIQASAANYAMVLAEARRLESQGQASAVTEAGNNTIQLSASAEAGAYLQTLATSQALTFNTLLQSNLNVQASFTRVISTGQEFTDFWRQYVSTLDAVPAVDFSSNSVLAVFPGPQANTGYTTTIQSVRQSGKTLGVSYSVSAAQAGVPANFTPVHVIVVPVSKLRGDFDTVDFQQQ